MDLKVWTAVESVLSLADLAECIEALKAGKIIGLPTETVYGLAVDARNEAALERLQSWKGRSSDKTLPIQVADLQQVTALAGGALSSVARRLFERFSPGPLTVVLQGPEDIPRLLQGSGGSIGIRIPDHDVTLQVLQAAGFPLAVTSANRTGEPPALDFPSMLRAFGDAGQNDTGQNDTGQNDTGQNNETFAGVIDGGPSQLGRASTVVDVTGDTPQILREGAISAEEVFAAVRELCRPEGTQQRR